MTINQKRKIEVICNFTSIDECEDAINAIKKGHPVLIYFGDIETTLANSIFTIMSGAVYALDGGKHQVDSNTFIFFPKNVEITT